MLVRPATFDDVPEIARVHVASAAAVYGDLIPAGTDQIGRRNAMWTTLLEDPACAPFVAEAGGEIVGVLNVAPGVTGPRAGELDLLYVHPDWWGSGAAQQLIEQAHRVLDERFETATLTVLAANPRARRFYERNGWRLQATVVEPHFGGHATEVARYARARCPDATHRSPSSGRSSSSPD
jgi:GNAT superfamily N-acetyltransferase